MIKSTNYIIFAVILSVVAYTGAVFYVGVKYGSSSTAQELATYVATQQQVAIEANNKREQIEVKLDKINTDNEQNLIKVRKEYETDKVNSTRAHTVRMQQLETRERNYRFMSQASDTERRALADTAAELDRTLTEGRQLVEELRHEVALRNTQLKVIGEQIHAERNYSK